MLLQSLHRLSKQHGDQVVPLFSLFLFHAGQAAIKLPSA